MNSLNLPGLLIGAPRSGGGKTTLTLGLLRALHKRGLKVQPLKCGPDYIDPGFHTKAAGRTSVNIDSWAMRETVAHHLVATHSDGADLIIAEALMGVFDGVEHIGAWSNGESAHLAATAGWPIVLILDVAGQSQTVGAVAKGFVSFRPDVEIGGVILNRAGSDRHVRLARAGLERAGLRFLGALPRSTEIELPERHLGLVLAEETEELETRLDALADFVSAHVDLDDLIALASARSWNVPGGETLSHAPMTPPGQRIALARDAAFSFVYPHILSAWRAAGAELLPFSPLNNETPDTTSDVVWLPGGYPELHAGVLSLAERFLGGLRTAAQTKPVHGECGGFMVLGAGLEDSSGSRHQMAGLLDLETSFAKRKMHLGYRRAVLHQDCPIGQAGATVRGHEFHYASITQGRDEPLADLFDAQGQKMPETGARRGLVSGTFFHMIDAAD